MLESGELQETAGVYAVDRGLSVGVRALDCAGASRCLVSAIVAATCRRVCADSASSASRRSVMR